MAQPAKRSESHAAVAACGATDSAHNDAPSCTADEIRISMKGGSPVCQTFEPETPKARP